MSPTHRLRPGRSILGLILGSALLSPSSGCGNPYQRDGEMMKVDPEVLKKREQGYMDAMKSGAYGDSKPKKFAK